MNSPERERGHAVDLRLSDGDRICIVGGGPAGAFAALHLLDLAGQRGLRLEVLIFEPRDFSRPGPGGCNRCAGILSSHLLQGLERLGIHLPAEVVQAEIKSYVAHLDDQLLTIQRPGPQRRIVSVYRGGGPRLHPGGAVSSFDGYLLGQAQARGAQLIPQRVRQIEQGQRPLLQTSDGEIVADLLVVATGINSRPPLSPAFGYQRPRTATMAQDEVLRPPTWPADRVDVFFRQPPGLIFGALIPKGNYLNISLLGRGLTRDTVSDFIEAQRLDALLSSVSESLCGCTPRIAIDLAPKYFGDRWVVVGDAAVTRLYKDGIGSAFGTSRHAMQAALEHGISSAMFARGYAPYCRQVDRDNSYGRLLFYMWSFVLRTPLLLRIWIASVERESEWPLEQRLHQRLLWGMFSGDEPYRDLFWTSLHPGMFTGLGGGWWSMLRRGRL
jgi:flavin-dependent dehydrogenase